MSAKDQLSNRVEWVRENYLKQRPEIEKRYNESNHILMLLQEIDVLCKFSDELIAENEFYKNIDKSKDGAFVEVRGELLKPCPFCGGTSLEGFGLTSIFCKGCYQTFTVSIASGFNTVAHAWNQRAKVTNNG
jgi:DNA repair exonuclease SbcCD ATPase subunit